MAPSVHGGGAHFVRIRDTQSKIALIMTHALNVIRVTAKQSSHPPRFVVRMLMRADLN